METENVKTLFEVVKVYSESQDVWLPAIKDLKTHDFDPLWTAAIMFLVYDRYMSNIDDHQQAEFAKSTMECFDKMMESGHSYIEKIKTEKDLG